ncbi:acyl-CoA dehydrogenase family protein [Paraburkholderia sp. MMS20-SJTR3]|uniref:Acyl-CoA dehydrogenase family protein n=1 Tax=Paraburkholderia sejongensis TaxID=2886946 RepID=A0ABS8K130_9BURK|nr:acyl-CoA dehydrogenase family protein [Paraburkholderia sp. MMS20-SJTR3]MCC8395846.1 acyl-CoA dehydrogenase family protein [Paraburkholderia sp. MMS20-SJTR3]
MDFSLTEDHVALQDAVRRFCDGEYPAHRRGDAQSRELAASRRRGLAELGVTGLAIGEQHGGSGYGAVETMLVAQELGRALGGAGWLASGLPAAALIGAAGSAAQQDRWLAPAASGDKLLAFAVGEAESRYDVARIAVAAVETGDGWRIDGTKTIVFDAADADAFVVAVRTSGQRGDRHGLSLFVVDAQAAGLHLRTFETIDAREAAHVSFDQVAVGRQDLLGKVGEAYELIEAALDRANAALVAESVGALEALLDHTAEHLRTRTQFGAPLAKFQALQHRIADMLIALEQSKSMACAAAMAVDGADAEQRRRFVSAAKAYVGDACRAAGEWGIQLHGGMGMTEECRAGHYAKRMFAINQTYGDASWHLQRFTELRAAREAA